MIEISCSKPECFWKGPANEAATHECPTPPTTSEADESPEAAPAAATGAPLFATRQELESWLAQHGEYDAQGNPGNAETAEADRQYALFLAADKAGTTSEPPPEPSLDDEATDEAWETRVALQLQARDDYRQLRYALVDEDAGELVDAHPLKNGAEMALVPFLDAGREITIHKVGEIVKAAIALEDAAAADQNLKQPFGDEGPPLAPPGTVPADDPSLEPEQTMTDEPSPEPEPSKGSEPTAIEKLEQAAEAAGGTLETEERDVIEHPDRTAEPQGREPSIAAQLEPAVPLFDAADYDKPGLQIPKVDGHAIDRIGLTFGGGVMLDRSEPNDVTLYNRIHGQQTIELWIEAKWGGTGAKPATNRDGDLDVIVGHKSLRVESIRIVDPAALGALEGLELVRAAARRAQRAGVPDDQIENACIDALAEQE
jgi:hypothetical protein